MGEMVELDAHYTTIGRGLTATVRINGFTPEELQNRETFELIHPDDRAEVGRVFAEVLATSGSVRIGRAHV